jgi:serine protease SohB
MDLLATYGIFALKTFTLVMAILFLTAGLVSITRKPRSKLDVVSLNKQYDTVKQLMQKSVSKKKIKKPKKEKNTVKSTLFVINFTGDIKASQVDALREEVSAVLSVARTKDEVVVCVESAGGTVNGYGLAASQLQRIRDKHIPLTVCIDKIAASGGYLMACVANRILAAPFAIVGSIGVVAQIPNVHRWLKKNDIDVELMTAGEYKRTLTIFGENTNKGRQKFAEDLEKVHINFSNYILSHRENVDIKQVATGEHWLAQDALGLHLVDALQTSDDYLISKINTHNLLSITAQEKTSLLNKLVNPVMRLLHPFG